MISGETGRWVQNSPNGALFLFSFTPPLTPFPPPPLSLSNTRSPEMGPYGQKQMITPNLDKLAASGLTFNGAYAQQAVCGPSRASFMSEGF